MRREACDEYSEAISQVIRTDHHIKEKREGVKRKRKRGGDSSEGREQEVGATRGNMTRMDDVVGSSGNFGAEMTVSENPPAVSES